ncbi:DUF3823 domain-containing protein [Flavihumibacter petaseus]|uniref:DUF3823 domain-containing protein n=1 Tax=Flavihumibacter petaseus NBRC 106054 TaxID=1220578 RepID=A0A0E9MYU1_9BACT|nr:DUF3823 domain-containing protein [Flavihumibacter petaseus]GAO42566.1 hypothetical protein FPE01S_01_15810 [Flavihumibacter petaseus NBRC 106054]
MKLRMGKLLLGACILLAASCVKPDNYDGPDASFEGSVLNEGFKQNLQTCTGNFAIRLEQLSWSETPSPQDIPIKYDGTFKNSKLFSGHYRVSLKGGAFWPIPPVELDISKGTTYDFQVTPYLNVENFTYELDGTTLTLHFNVSAPIDGIPNVIEVQPYVNTTEIVGPGASIYDFSDVFRKTVNKAYTDLSEEDRTITIEDLIPGRTFFVRVGVRFDNSDKSSNLSEIIKIEVPQQ